MQDPENCIALKINKSETFTVLLHEKQMRDNTFSQSVKPVRKRKTEKITTKSVDNLVTAYFAKKF